MLPTLNGLVAALIAGGFAVGIVLLAMYIRGVEENHLRRPALVQRATEALRSPAFTSRLAGAVVAGVLGLVLTHWPVAAVGLAALVVFWPQMFGGARLEQSQMVQLEALVMWTESLRDTITARASLEQAIPATAYSAPEAIRPALIRLTGLVRSRVPLDQALLAMSADLNDGSADQVLGSLVLNTRQRGTGLASVLTELASSARAELDQRRRISAGRASMRRSVQIVVAITVAFALFLALFSPTYVAPYSSVGGQVALCVIFGFFAISFVWMRRLAGGEPAEPFLIRPDARVSDDDLRVIGYLTGLTEAETRNLVADRQPESRPGARR